MEIYRVRVTNIHGRLMKIFLLHNDFNGNIKNYEFNVIQQKKKKKERILNF